MQLKNLGEAAIWIKNAANAGAILTPQVIASAVGTGKLSSEAGACAASLLNLTAAEGAAATGASGMSTAFAGLGAVIQAHPILAAVAAITAVVTAYTTYQRKQEEARQATINAGKAAADEAKNIRELYAEYQKVSDAYKNNAATKEELSTATDNLLSALGTERSQIQNLTDDYSNLDDTMASLVDHALELKRMQMAEAVSAAGTSLQKAVKTPQLKLGNYRNSTDEMLVESLLSNGLLSESEVLTGLGFGGGEAVLKLKVDISTAEGAAETFKRLVDLRNQLLDIAKESGIDDSTLRGTKIWNYLDYYISEANEKYKDYTESLQSYGNELARSEYKRQGNPIPKTVKEYEELKASIADAVHRQKDFTGSQDDAVQIADSFIKSLNLTISDFDVFKSKANKLSKKTLNDFTKGEQLTTEQTEELSKWLKDSGYSAEQAAPYFERLAKEMQSASDTGLSTDASIANLTSLQEELQQTTADLEAYKAALEGGEKGDAAEEYADAWSKAIADIEAGKYDTRAVQAAAKLLFSDAQLQEWGYDLTRAATEMQSSMLQTVFGDEENTDFGKNFANYIRENQELFKDAAKITENADGTFDFAYTSIKDLADASGLAEGTISALLDALDVFGVQSMMSGEEFSQLTAKFHEGGNDIKAFIGDLAEAGHNEFEIKSIVDSLAKAGEISESDLAGLNIAKTISEAVAQANQALAESETPTLDVDASAGLATAAAFEARLNEIAAGTYEAKLTVSTDDGEDKPKEKFTPSDPMTNLFGNAMATLDLNNTPFMEKLGEAKSRLDELDGSSATATADLNNQGVTDGVSESESQLNGLDGMEVNPIATLNDNVTGPLAAAEANFLSKNGKSISWGVSVSVNDAGFSHTSGKFASGTTNAPGGPALVNELGPELISDNGKAYIAGGGKPTITNLSPGAIVLTAQQTKQAFAGSYRNIPIHAFASGTKNKLLGGGSIPAHAMMVATEGGGGGKKKTVWDVIKGVFTSATVPSSSGKQKTGGGGGGGGDNSSSSKAEEAKKEKVDWIEIAIDRIERAVDKLNAVFENGYKKLSTRIDASAKEIAKINEEISIQQKAAERYMREADSVGLSSELAEKVRNGTIDINSYDEDTRNLISDYQKWYEKSLECSEAVDTLHNSLAELYEARFGTIQKDFENKLDEIEHRATMLESENKLMTTRGRMESISYYEQMKDLSHERAVMLANERSELAKEMQTALDSGEIEEYSEAWYEFNSTLYDIDEELAEINIGVAEFDNNIRQIKWDSFDYLQDKISQITTEANFMIDLLSDSKLFDDNGNVTSEGNTLLGLHGQNFNTYEKQAALYAKEIKDIEKELNSDPYNNDLIKRREELLKLQQESIKSAHDEKQAIVDLVKQGIDAQLSAMKELIDSYKEGLDNAKSLYDYQNKIADKTSNISKLQKQLAAYAGDNSEETRSTVQKLRTELEKAQKDLQDTEYDHMISEQKKMLDDFYDEYEETLNSRLDDTDALISEVVDEIGVNAEEIITTLQSTAASYGYTLSSETESIWKSGLAVIDSLYAETTAFYEKEFSGVGEAIKSIARYVDAIYGKGESVKQYATGGKIDYTGLAKVDGTPQRPEMVLDATDTQNFLALRDTLRNMAKKDVVLGNYGIGSPGLSGIADITSLLASMRTSVGSSGTTFGDFTINIPIEHVQDVNDFMNQLRDNEKFENFIRSITIDRLAGRSSLEKYKYKW